MDLYNRTAAERSLEAFVMHMHVEWLYMLHAKFKRDGPDYRYRQARGRRFVRVDSEVKTWELARCLRQAFPETNPVRCNVEFLIKARNKIEHRYEEPLATKTQAHVLNYEETLTAWFPGEGLGDSLRFPVFMSSLTLRRGEDLEGEHRKLPKKLTTFIREHDASLPSEVAEDWRYDFRVLLLPQTGPTTESDAVMRFVREDEMTPDVARAREVVQTIVRDKLVGVENKDRRRPGAVAKLVSEALGVKFTPSTHHVAAWRNYEIRPSKDASRLELTNGRYCVWDEPHEDYVYTDAWVKKLIRELADPEVFERVTGKPPVQLRDAPTRTLPGAA